MYRILYSPINGVRTDGFMPFPRALASSEKQSLVKELNAGHCRGEQMRPEHHC